MLIKYHFFLDFFICLYFFTHNNYHLFWNLTCGDSLSQVGVFLSRLLWSSHLSLSTVARFLPKVSSLFSFPTLPWITRWWRAYPISVSRRKKKRKFPSSQDANQIYWRNVCSIYLVVFWRTETKTWERWRTHYGWHGKWVQIYRLWMWEIVLCSSDLDRSIKWNRWSKMGCGTSTTICYCCAGGEGGS